MSIKAFFCKNIFLFFLLFTLSFGANAQNFYLKIAGGYAGASTESNIGMMTNPMENEGFLVKYGSGVNGLLGVGYSFNKHFSLGLNTTYFGSYKMNDVFVNGLERVEYDVVVKRYIQLSPVVQLSTERKKTYVYGEAGLVLPFFNDTEIDRNAIIFEGVDNLIASQINQKATVRYQAKIGYTGTLGIAYPLSKKTAVYVEATQMALKTYPERSTITVWNEDEVDVLGTKNQIDTEIIFVDELTETSNRTNPNLPLNTIRTSVSFGHLNFKFGWELIF